MLIQLGPIFLKLFKMSYKIFVFFFALSLFWPGHHSSAQQQQKLLVSMEYWTPAQKQFLKDNRLANVTVIYEKYFVDDNSRFNRQRFQRTIDAVLPDKNQSGYAVLDWEGESFIKLIGDKKTTPQEYNQIQNEFIEAITCAKQIRPNIKWSFFGFNPSAYPYADHRLKLQTEKMSPLLSHLDFFAPALYIQDEINGENNPQNIRFIYSNLKNTILLNKTNKEIFPFIWHRYHNTEENNYLIGDEGFKWYISKILSTEINSRKVTGVIWWNSESYLAEKKNKSKTLQQEFNRQSKNANYQYHLLAHYYRILRSAFQTPNE